MKPLLVRHLGGEPIGRFPVWLMRQAGRYLPQYREVRKQYSFWEMVTKPKVAAEVSLQPVDLLGVDAVIFFSDILSLPYGMGIEIELKESIGPVIKQPLECAEDFQIFWDFNPEKHTQFVGEALSLIREKLSHEKALIGFAGAPWTVACYLIEGQGKRGFLRPKEWACEDPESLAKSLEVLSQSTARYLQYQAKSGAQVLQVFDTWVSEMPPHFFKTYYKPVLERLFKSLRSSGVPLVYFPKGGHPFREELVDLDFDVLGIDSGYSMKHWDLELEGKFCLQGNLDPQVLRNESIPVIRKKTRQLVQEARVLKRPAVINLGHGVDKETPVENVRAFIEEAKEAWI